MSGHRRVKNYAYDEDDVDDYDSEYDEQEGGGLTAEDKEQLRLGTVKVKEALGPSIQVSDGEIEEALWHYYYDVGKSVTYLKNKHAHAPKPEASQKKQKAASRFDMAANSAAASQSKKTSAPVPPPPFPVPLPLDHTPMSAADFFRDTPWLNVPLHRRGNILCEPLYPPGRLLGGSSKLAALAAARRKKQEESKSIAPSTEGSEVEDKEPDRAVALLGRLGNQEKKENTPVASEQPKSSLSGFKRPLQNRSYPVRKKKSPSPPPVETLKEPPKPEPKPSPMPDIPDLRAAPSTFAATMLGPRLSLGSVKPEVQDGSIFTLPYASEPGFTKRNPFAGPSPDDVVMNAQAKGNLGKKTPAATKKTHGATSTNGVTEGVEALTVEDAPKVKSKNLDVLKEFEKSNMKKAASFVVVGHVDHGKSTLMGRLLYDLKVIDQRSVDRLRKEAENIGKSSFALAWVMDQTSDERERGVTVDIATNNFETEKTRFTILDAPGHKDFVPNMIAGASQADFAVLVVDASTNSFESGLRGQTKEHALLVRSMGVSRLVIVVNKMDMVNWSQERFQEISQQMSAFLISAGFQAKNITFVPCSGLSGQNIIKPLAEGVAPWYKGHTLVEELDASEPAARALEKPLRMTIADIFRGGVTNPLSISGKLESGSLQVGDEVVAMPSGEKAVVKGIEVDNDTADWAVAGQIVTLHLTDIDAIHLRLGDIICNVRNPIKNIKSFTAKILAFEHVMPMYVDVFRGRLNAPARVTKLLAVLDKASGEITKKKPRIIQPGSVARVVVELSSEMPLEAPSRVVLRAEGQTIAAGLLESAT